MWGHGSPGYGVWGPETSLEYQVMGGWWTTGIYIHIPVQTAPSMQHSLTQILLREATHQSSRLITPKGEGTHTSPHMQLSPSA